MGRVDRFPAGGQCELLSLLSETVESAVGGEKGDEE